MKKYKPYHILFTILLLLCVISCAGCVNTPETHAWQPQLSKITDNADYNLYLIDYCGGDYKLDEVLNAGFSTMPDFCGGIGEVLAPGKGISINLPDTPLCSAFCVKDTAEYLVGRNFDLSDTDSMLVHTKPADGYASLAITGTKFLNLKEDPLTADETKLLPAPYACMDGINEKGLCILINHVDGPGINQTRGNTVICAPPLLIRLVLDKAATVDEAVALLDRYDFRSLNNSYQFLIADKSGKTAVINYVDNEMVVTPDAKLVTNFYLCAVPDNYPAGHGQDRFETAEKILNAAGYKMNAEQSFEVLQAVEQTGSRSSTQWSVVYHLGTTRADIVCHRHWETVSSYTIG